MNVSELAEGRAKVGHLPLSEQTKNETQTQQPSGCGEAAEQTFLIHTAANGFIYNFARAAQGCSGHIKSLLIFFHES